MTASPDNASVNAAIANAPADPPGLYVVATPIGNLADISLRALRVLARAGVVACEDTRVTRKLMTRYGLSTPLLSYHEHNAEARRPELIGRLAEGEIVALVSDAGTPMVSDPGSRLVMAAIEEGHAVFSVPGASALLAALVVAGLPCDRFWFEGFLPPKQAARRARIAELARIDGPVVIYEAPHRVTAALADLAEGLGDRPAVLARELTKRFETVLRAPLPELAASLAAGGSPKGEIVLVIGPGAGDADLLSDAEIDDRLADLAADMGVKRAAAQLAAETGLRRSDLYRRALELGDRRAAGDDGE
ncbi:16S rRNA (cytidine(1402)-2'-O)-methyltransferase [Microbaculum marinum]|uniref:Ribosomal RNA small subunit methyltransferase I n=1 Tax=Microbaculum marinum TaxID=1764581 RepID=A0AAW9RUY5_9HYPH